MARINYVELGAGDVAAARAFYEAVFGWRMQAFGPDYAATVSGDVDLGLDGAGGAAPLPVIAVADLAAAEAAVVAAGGAIVRPAFSFPGGRRFHFRDPAGNVLAAWVEE
ncbi:VOC family protein [Sphingomonas morindae]|uniref:VOC family protein n=1 Tax=Sphingomonas morindae TaxID=1541170 RepID=A0ABY4X5D6_9SPHN|nr:VOC family protein [Sphingomonas morindae]USI72093.1 VOC family protein [Sphingomonas morindae]